MGSPPLLKCSAKSIKTKGPFLLKLTWILLIELYNQYKCIYTGRHFEHDLLNHFAFIKELRGKKAYTLITRTENKKTPCEFKKRHNSGFGQISYYCDTYLPPWLQGNGKSLGEILKKCIPHAIWLQCLKQLMWSNITLGPQIKDQAGQRTQS